MARRSIYIYIMYINGIYCREREREPIPTELNMYYTFWIFLGIQQGVTYSAVPLLASLAKPNNMR